ncbi:MAG: DUF3426 domain-containing protein [Sideroxyarcus sp.]|nr:DUF3426 domain-containing protein [Sideroxyarcus sp.]
MTAITQCPECGTRFKVTDAQIDAHDGLVRCGRCQEAFNARQHLHDDEPSPQLSLPIEPETLTDEHTEAENRTGGLEAGLSPIANTHGLEEVQTSLAHQVRFVEELTDEVTIAPSRTLRWMGILIALLLTLTLIAQATYFFRVELAARLPGLKPVLAQYCTLLACNIGLPQKADLMVIESSELESDPQQGNVVTLHALLHNRADYAQDYPSLELTLTDLQDHAIARRVFHPADYVKSNTDEKLGIQPNREFDIKLHLDTTDLMPSGYRLFLFYPQ